MTLLVTLRILTIAAASLLPFAVQVNAFLPASVSRFQFFSAQPLRPLRLSGELFAARIHRRDAENAELTQRVNQIETLPCQQQAKFREKRARRPSVYEPGFGSFLIEATELLSQLWIQLLQNRKFLACPFCIL